MTGGCDYCTRSKLYKREEDLDVSVTRINKNFQLDLLLGRTTDEGSATHIAALSMTRLLMQGPAGYGGFAIHG